MKALKRLLLASTVSLGGFAWADPPPPPAPAPALTAAGKRSPQTERDTMVASMKNFALLLAASPDVKEIPNSKFPTHDVSWYSSSLADLQRRVAADQNPGAPMVAASSAAAVASTPAAAPLLAIDGYQKEYDALKQAFLDQVYDACPSCYNRDKRIAVRTMQMKLDEAVVLDQRRQRENITRAQAARLDRMSARLETMNRFALRSLKDDMGMANPPRTEVDSDGGGRRTFRDLIRQNPVLPTAGRWAAANVPPPPIDGDWRPNSWVSRSNWADYQKLVPWLTTVLKETGTYDLMQSLGIKPIEYTLALISTESSFFHGSQSNILNRSTGAVTHAYGFMQVLQGTARRMLAGSMDEYRAVMAQDRAAYAALDPAQRGGVEAPQAVLTSRQLTGASLKTNWKTNVFAGVAYLKQNLLEFSDRLRDAGVTSPAEMGPVLQGLVAASYNAGEGAVRKYWGRLDIAREDPTQSIVPYRETRDYVLKINTMTAMNWLQKGT